jgi:hypothetical protein
MTRDKTRQSLLGRLDEAVLRGRGRNLAPGLEYGLGAKAGLRAEAVARELTELQERVASLEARLAALEEAE